MYRSKIMPDDISSPERMDFSEESSFEASPLNPVNRHHTRPNQQIPSLKNRYNSRRMSCPPPLSPFGPSLAHQKSSKRKSTGDFLDSIDRGFTGMQLESPPSDLKRHSTFPQPQSNTSSTSSKSIFSLSSLGFGGGSSSTNNQIVDQNEEVSSDDSDTTIVSGGMVKQDSNNNGKVFGTKKSAKRVSQKVGDLSTILDRSEMAENDDEDSNEDDRMSTASKSSAKTTQSQRQLMKQNARVSNRKGRCLCYLHSLVLCSAIVIMTYFGSREMHKQWCTSRQDINVTLLQQQLQSKVFGQHVATDLIVKVFQEFTDGGSTSEGHSLGSSVVFSFHGWTGVGKNYISSIIADLIPSANVIKLIVPLHFPYTAIEYSEQYKQNMEEWIVSNVSDCALNLFLIDEMDKAGSQLLQGLQSAIRTIKSSGFNEKKVVILLLSNTGGTLINKVLFDHLSEGNERDMLVHDTLQEAVLNDPITTWHKDMFQQNLIDYIVPFLPLQQQHVEMCIRKYLERRSIELQESTIKRIVDDFEYFPPGNPMFSKSGCKRVESKTDLYI